MELPSEAWQSHPNPTTSRPWIPFAPTFPHRTAPNCRTCVRLLYVRPVPMSVSRLVFAALFLGSAVSCSPQMPTSTVVREDKRYSVSLDLSDPKNYSGIPAVTWFPMGDGEFCAIQGVVALDVKLPDGKRVVGEFSIVYIHRDADGVFRIRADSLGWLGSDADALSRIKLELHKWGSDVYTPAQFIEREGAVSTWIASSRLGNMSEGFRVRRKRYEVNFSLFSFGGPGLRFYYELRLGEPGRKKLKPNNPLGS